MRFRDLFRAKPSAPAPDTEAMLRAGQALVESNRLTEALQQYDTLIQLRPDCAEGYYKRGNVYNRMGRWPEALAEYDRAVALNPDYAYAFCNRGTVLERLKRWGEALSSYDRALALNPNDAFAHYNRASVLRELQRPEEALASYDQAIALNGGYVEAYVNRGHLLHKSGRHEQAAASYSKAIELCPYPLQTPPGAVAALQPEQKFLLGQKRFVLLQVCDWRGLSADIEQIAAGLQRQLPVIFPIPALAMLSDSSLQRAAAECWAREAAPPDPALGPIATRPRAAQDLRPEQGSRSAQGSRSERIRVGYFSSDYRMHPVAYLAAGLFEQHDRSRFELIAFSFGPETQDPMRVRTSKAFDRFIDINARSDVEVATLARELKIDIAVDLNGVTEHSRTKVFALRAAPLQVNYLGYAGTMGAPYMDYLIADGVVVPRARQRDCVEKIIYLPGSFMPFDSGYAISARTFTREELGLPRTGVVFCCFNNTFKFTPEIFATWMRILQRREGSVLWLSYVNATAANNLKQTAVRSGIDERRLIFATRLESLPEHLARLRVADLFLDTFPYNAHATSMDALWAGLPVLTCGGASFASRVASSLLSAVGLPELVTRSLQEYEELALSLSAQPERLVRIRDILARNRLTSSLFDTTQYVKKLETAYEAIYNRHLSGAPPDHINEELAT